MWRPPAQLVIILMCGVGVAALCSDDIEIDWRLQRGIAVSRYKKDMQRSRLTVRDLRLSDEGDYVCIGINHFGRTEFTFQLVIYGA